MSAETINHWLTLGANFGVLIGIILLVVELDQNRETIRAQSRSDISRHISDYLSMLGSESNLASLVRRAEAGEVLTLDEETQQFYLFTANKRMWENIFYQYNHGLFAEQEYEAERQTWRFLINKDKSFSRNWCLTRQNYSPDFVIELESLLDNTICVDG